MRMYIGREVSAGRQGVVGAGPCSHPGDCKGLRVGLGRIVVRVEGGPCGSRIEERVGRRESESQRAVVLGTIKTRDPLIDCLGV